MNILKLTFIIVFLTVIFRSPAIAHGGSTAGDGGHGIACISSHYSRVSVALVDLYEARYLYKIRPDLGPWYKYSDELYFSSALGLAKKRLRLVLPSDHPVFSVFNTAQKIVDSAFTQVSSRVIESQDLGPMALRLPSECRIVQLANWSWFENNWPHLVVNNDYWWRLEKIDRVALILHEAFHTWFRDQQSTLAIRQTIAFLVANDAFRSGNANTIRQVIISRHAAPTKSFISEF